jgi:O-antigen/teichoic acid export membrane protein
VAGSFFSVFLKPEWQPGVLILQILCIASPFNALCVTNNNVLLAKGLSSLFLKIELLKKVLLVGCLLATIRYDITALVSGLAVYHFLSFAVSAITTGRVIAYTVSDQLKDLFPYLSISLIMSGAVFSLSFIINNVYILLPVQVLAGLFIYWWLCKSLGSKVYGEIVAEIRRKIRK